MKRKDINLLSIIIAVVISDLMLLLTLFGELLS